MQDVDALRQAADIFESDGRTFISTQLRERARRLEQGSHSQHVIEKAKEDLEGVSRNIVLGFSWGHTRKGDQGWGEWNDRLKALIRELDEA